MQAINEIEYLTQSERLELCAGRALPIILSPASIGQDERPTVTLSTPRFPLGSRPARVGEGILHGYGGRVAIEDGEECEAMEGEDEADTVHRPARAYDLPSRGMMPRSEVVRELGRMGYTWGE